MPRGSKFSEKSRLPIFFFSKIKKILTMIYGSGVFQLAQLVRMKRLFLFQDVEWSRLWKSLCKFDFSVPNAITKRKMQIRNYIEVLKIRMTQWQAAASYMLIWFAVTVGTCPGLEPNYNSWKEKTFSAQCLHRKNNVAFGIFKQFRTKSIEWGWSKENISWKLVQI